MITLAFEYNENYELKATFVFGPKSHFKYQMWPAPVPCVATTLPVTVVDIHLRFKTWI